MSSIAFFIDYAKNCWNRKSNINLGLSYLPLRASAWFFISCAVTIVIQKNFKSDSISCAASTQNSLDAQYNMNRCHDRKWYYVPNRNSSTGKIQANNYYAQSLLFICTFVGLFLVWLSCLWSLIERKHVANIFDHHFKGLDPYRSAQLIVAHVNNFKDKNYFYGYVIFWFIQVVAVCITFGVIGQIMDVRVNGISTNVFDWVLKEHEDRKDYLSSKFPETVLCSLESYSAIGQNINHENIQCHLGINILYQTMHIFALWLHLGLLIIVIFDFGWHLYLFGASFFTPILSKMTLEKHLFCLLLEKNLPALTWSYVLDLLSDKNDVETGIDASVAYGPPSAPKKDA